MVERGSFSLDLELYKGTKSKRAAVQHNSQAKREERHIRIQRGSISY